MIMNRCGRPGALYVTVASRKKEALLAVCLFLISINLFSQRNDSVIVAEIYREALTSDLAYNNLRDLVNEIGPRLCGSDASLEAVKFTRKLMLDYGFDEVFLHEITGPNWEPSKLQEGTVFMKNGLRMDCRVSALGPSVGTPAEGITGRVVEVRNKSHLDSLGRVGLEGKIAFFNEPMDPGLINPFSAYGKAVWQRSRGASLAAEYGAIAVLVRSLSLTIDTFPHTGVMRYSEGVEKIPAMAISTADAEKVSASISAGEEPVFKMKLGCINYPDSVSYNVIGELKGTDFPESYIVVSGHLDSWFNDPGAHDDGAGCVQAIEVLRIFKELGIKPRHTVRAIMYMDEEMNQSGGKQYAERARQLNERHVFAMESDGGGTTPIGFTVTVDSVANDLARFLDLLKPYGIGYIREGWGGVDIGPLREQNVPLIGLNVDPHRYFEWHHCANDTFDKVSKRELQLGSASMAALIYLLDKYYD